MRIVILASGAFANPSIRHLAQGPHEIALVVTQPARGSGRGRHPTPTPVKLLASELNLPVVEIENVNVSDFVTRIRDVGPRVMLAIAFGQKLGNDFLGASPGGAINLHASLLPKYRGAAPINWAIVRGETRSGCTVFKIVSKMDAGPILAQDATEIQPDETAGDLHDRLALLGVETVQKSLALFETNENPPGMLQDEALVTIAPKLKKSDGYIGFSQPASEIVNQIRGMTPWPGAAATLHFGQNRSEVVAILRARASDSGFSASNVDVGTLDQTLCVRVGAGRLEILEIQPAGGKAMPWADFVRGRRLNCGDRFERP